MRQVKVFVSSPSELAPERQIVSDEVAQFGLKATIKDKYTFTAFRYEQIVAASIGDGPQKTVDQQMMRAKDADIVVCMFWTRFGTPMKDYNPDTREEYGSGTEYEFYDAYRELKKRKQQFWRRKQPQILLYRKMTDKPDADPVQKHLVQRFFNRFNPPAQIDGIFKTFTTEAEFREMLVKDLDMVVADWNRPVERVMGTVRPFLPFIPLVVLLAALLLVIFAPKPLPIKGFNIAMAGFIPDAGSGLSDTDVRGMSEAFYNDFKSKVEALDPDKFPIPAVWSPSDVGQVKGDTPDARSADAQALIARVEKRQSDARANMVIYGVVRKDGEKYSIEPEFYIPPDFAETSEVLGRFGIQDAVVTRDALQARLMTFELGTKAKLLTSISQGFAFMILQRYDEAYTMFSELLPATPAEAKLNSGMELLYILRGNAALMNYNTLIVTPSKSKTQADYLNKLIGEAVDDYKSASMLNPDYSRALAGYGSVLYLQTVGKVSAQQQWDQIADTDIQAIETAYNSAMNASDKPVTAEIPTKVNFGLGQAQLLRYLRTQTSTSPDLKAAVAAKEKFNLVIEEYKTADPNRQLRIRELVAQAYGFLGTLAKLTGDFVAARDAYNEAMKMTRLDARETVFRLSLMDVDFAEKRASRDYDGAAKAYSELMTGVRADGGKSSIAGIEAVSRLFQLGKLYTEAGRPDDAIVAYEKAVENGNADSDAALAAHIYRLLGDKYYDLKDYVQSSKNYRLAIKFEIDGSMKAKLEGFIRENDAALGTPVAPETPTLIPTGSSSPEATDDFGDTKG